MAIIATLLNFDSPYTAQFLLQEVFALAAAPPLLLWGGAFRRPVSL
jgi:hypothetical protein